MHRVGTRILVTTDSASKDETPSKKRGEMAKRRIGLEPDANPAASVSKSYALVLYNLRSNPAT